MKVLAQGMILKKLVHSPHIEKGVTRMFYLSCKLIDLFKTNGALLL